MTMHGQQPGQVWSLRPRLRGHRDHAFGGTSPGSSPHLLQALAATGAELGIESCSWLQATQGEMGRDQNVWWRWLTWCRRVLAHISVLPTPGAAKERPERPSWSACPPFLLLCWFLHHVLYLGALVILGKVNHLLSSCRRRRWSVTPIHVCAVEDRVRSLLVSHGPTSHSLRYLLRQLYELEGKSHISFLQVVYYLLYWWHGIAPWSALLVYSPRLLRSPCIALDTICLQIRGTSRAYAPPSLTLSRSSLQCPVQPNDGPLDFGKYRICPLCPAVYSIACWMTFLNEGTSIKEKPTVSSTVVWMNNIWIWVSVLMLSFSALSICFLDVVASPVCKVGIVVTK